MLLELQGWFLMSSYDVLWWKPVPEAFEQLALATKNQHKWLWIKVWPNEPVKVENGRDNWCHGTNHCGIDGNISLVVDVLVWWHPPRCDGITMITVLFTSEIPMDWKMFFFNQHLQLLKSNGSSIKYHSLIAAHYSPHGEKCFPSYVFIR